MEVLICTVYWSFAGIDYENEFYTLELAQAFYNTMSFADNIVDVELAVIYREE
jgi:hypothetical protein